MIGDMLEGRTKDGPVLVFGWFLHNGNPVFLVVKPDGSTGTVPLEQVSVDWHFDPESGWQRDFEEPKPEA